MKNAKYILGNENTDQNMRNGYGTIWNQVLIMKKGTLQIFRIELQIRKPALLYI